MDNLEVILAEVRDHLAQAVSTLDRALDDRSQPPPQVADWPSVDLSHLSVRKAIQNWLELLPNKRTASPAEIKKGLKAARPSMNDNQDTIQQSIYELAKEGKIRRDGWGQYRAK
jgi:hypothetical protein